MLTGASEYFDRLQQAANEAALRMLNDIIPNPNRDTHPLQLGVGRQLAVSRRAHGKREHQLFARYPATRDPK